MMTKPYLHWQYHPKGIQRAKIRQLYDRHLAQVLGYVNMVITMSRPINLKDILTKAALAPAPTYTSTDENTKPWKTFSANVFTPEHTKKKKEKKKKKKTHKRKNVKESTKTHKRKIEKNQRKERLKHGKTSHNSTDLQSISLFNVSPIPSHSKSSELNHLH